MSGVFQFLYIYLLILSNLIILLLLLCSNYENQTFPMLAVLQLLLLKVSSPFFWTFFKTTFIYVQFFILIYNIVIFSVIHQHELAIGIQMSLPSHQECWFWVPCVIQQILTGYLLYLWQCICFHFYTLKSSHLFSPPLYPKVCSLCLHLHCSPVKRFISTIFLDSINVCNIYLSRLDLLHFV